MKKKCIIFIFASVLSVFLVVQFCQFLGYFAGSYAYAERYEIDAHKKEFILRISQFKVNNPQYQLITTDETGDSIAYPDGNSNNFFNCYFYFQDIDQTIHCAINVNGASYPVVLAFSGISRGVNFASWRKINSKDLSKEENNAIKRKFEVEILDKLGVWRHD